MEILLGFLILFFGRRLFWLFLGGTGFLLGLRAAGAFLPYASDVIVLGLALAMGLAGVVIAFLLQWLAVGLAGFAAGCYLAVNLVPPEYGGIAALLIVLAAGFAGMVLMSMSFEWALIFMSALLGASILNDNMALENAEQRYFVFLALTGLGIIVQAWQRKIDRIRPARKD